MVVNISKEFSTLFRLIDCGGEVVLKEDEDPQKWGLEIKGSSNIKNIMMTSLLNE